MFSTLSLSRIPALLVAVATLAPFPAAAQTSVGTALARKDLYRAANGAWLDATVIPADKSEVYGADLPGTVNTRLRRILDDLRTQAPASGDGRKLIDFYDSQRDLDAIDRAGLAPVAPRLTQIEAIDTPQALARWQGQVQGVLKTPLWLWGGFADFKDPGVNRVLVMQGGLGLPDCDYYLRDDARLVAARQAYLAYLATLAQLAGDPRPQAAAQRVLALETRLAHAHVAAADAMNPALVASRTPAQLDAGAPGLAWTSYLQHAGIRKGEAVNVVQPPAAAAIAGLMRELPLADWKLYFRLRTLDASAPLLPAAFRAAHFAFHGRALGGQSAPRSADERALDTVTESMGDALGQAYMARHFSAAQKARVEGMVERIRTTAAAAVAGIAWMGPDARAEALRKIAGMRAKVGYPAAWRDYGGLEIRPADALGNRERARRHAWLRLAALSGSAMDRGSWAMSPLEPNAYYDPVLNEINLPAGILQAPFFDPEADDAANYGGIGVLIAHEISHAFDATGSQFDSRGMQRDWWSAADHAAFEAFTARMVAHFDALEVLPGARVNGKLTLSENVADLMGLQLAWRAWRGTAQGRAAAPGAEQGFFLAYARQWAVKRRDERTLQLLSTDPHAPAPLRANVPAMQLDGFHEAFSTRPGDRMFVPAGDRLRAW
ncbi:M13 family metallopeptidase [Massilia sp. 9I]|uniref:M13 family metallopeptidase n=1 Tax=Massilia sp. 9I TaxID=2653152 RepID=UPI0012F0AE34|nr:M13 family metallopeptidase [Massilia sp. 9I]VXC11146.1 putative Neprilysin [Massilia sp. 9I]